MNFGCDKLMQSDILPPWLQYPDQPPWWFGWRQGESEHWLLEVWFPYWNAMSRDEQLKYLEYRNVPEDWEDHVLEFWVHDET
jgi:hypothetical protein